MVDGDQYFEEPWNIIFKDDYATLKIETRGPSKQILPTYQATPCHIPNEGNIATAARTRNIAPCNLLSRGLPRTVESSGRPFTETPNVAEGVLMLKKVNISHKGLYVTCKKHDALRLSASCSHMASHKSFKG